MSTSKSREKVGNYFDGMTNKALPLVMLADEKLLRVSTNQISSS